MHCHDGGISFSGARIQGINLQRNEKMLLCNNGSTAHLPCCIISIDVFYTRIEIEVRQGVRLH